MKDSILPLGAAGYITSHNMKEMSLPLVSLTASLNVMMKYFWLWWRGEILGRPRGLLRSPDSAVQESLTQFRFSTFSHSDFMQHLLQ